MQAAVRRVQQLDPNWKPRPSLYETIDGEISANEAATREAQDRLYELQHGGIGFGPYAVEWQELRRTGRRPTAAEVRENDRIGREYGCHTCGTKDPGTPNGRFIFDHQPATRLLEPGGKQYGLPHCFFCSPTQGGYVRSIVTGALDDGEN
jgi:hypothetical protein